MWDAARSDAVLCAVYDNIGSMSRSAFVPPAHTPRFLSSMLTAPAGCMEGLTVLTVERGTSASWNDDVACGIIGTAG